MSAPASPPRSPWLCWKTWLATAGVLGTTATMVAIARPTQPAPIGMNDPTTGTYLVWSRQGHAGGQANLRAAVATTNGGGGAGEIYWQLAAQPEIVAAGQEQYDMFCLSCHGGPDTAGNAPSNLFDATWHYGEGPEGVARIIREGYATGGMPAWEAMLPADAIDSIMAYLFSHQTKN